VAIAEIWQRLLSVEGVSVTDNFFDLGGHSMLATRAINEIHKRLGLRISFPQMMYESLGQLSSSHEGTANRTQDEPAPKPGLLGRLLGPLRRVPKEEGRENTA
jgi:hypothetical protein